MQDKIKVLVYLAVWKRPEITEMCFHGLNRIRKHPDYDINVLAVISEEEMIPLCQRFNVNYVMHANWPLGNKKNFGLQACRNYDFDYLMEIGSDDLVMNELLDLYKEYIGKHDFFGVKDIAYINSEDGHCNRFRSNGNYGAGRMISRAALEKMDFKLWREDPPLDNCLDNNSTWNLGKKAIYFTQVRKSDHPMLVDVKSQVNIWKFKYDVGTPYDIELIFERLSPEEVDIIKALQCSPQEQG